MSAIMPEQPLKILLVDDDHVLCEYHKAILEHAGFVVYQAASPTDAMKLFLGTAPDLLVVDYHLPEMTGAQLAEKIRATEAGKRIGILMVTADEHHEVIAESIRMGVTNHLNKPLDQALFPAICQTMASNSRMVNTLFDSQQSLIKEMQFHQRALDEHAIVSMADSQGNITYINHKFCEISGYTQDELLGENHRILKSGIHPDSFYRKIWQIISQGEIWQGEICNRKKNGELYWVSSTIMPLADKHNSPSRYISIRTDITHVKSVENDLRRSEETLQATLESTRDGILAINNQMEIIFANRQFREMWRIPETLIKPGQNDQTLLEYVKSQLIAPDSFVSTVESIYLSEAEPNDKLEFTDGRIFERSCRLIRDKNSIIGRVWSFHDITESELAKREAESSKERLRRGQVYANIGTWEWEIDSGKLYWTERIPPLFGYPEGNLETSYANFIAAVHPEDRQMLTSAVNAAIEFDTPYELEHRVIWPDGTVRWLLERGAVQRDENGNARQMLGVVQDVDARKRAEMALEARERELMEAQSLAKLGNWQANFDTGTLVWSKEIYHIFGREFGRFVPSVQSFHDAVHPQDLEKIEKSMRKARSGEMHDVIHRIIRPDGSIRYVHELARPDFDQEGKLTGLTGTVQDITEQIASAKRLEVFMHTVRSVVDGVITINLKGIIQSFNPSACKIFGYEESDIVGKNVNQLMPEPYHSHHDEYLKRYQASHKGRIIGRQLELTGCRSDGTTFPIEIAVTEIALEDELLFVGLVRDITQRKQAENELITARDEAARANHAKSEFLSSMSHELRTPLNGILGFAQLLEYDTQLNNDQLENAHAILKAGRHLLDLINEILDLSKVESGRINLSLENVELDSVLRECLGLIETLAKKRQITLEYSALPQAVVVADRTRLKQVLLNLLSNAVKYNVPGGEVKIILSPADGHRIRITVHDTGPGIPKHLIPELFKPFSRLGAEHGEIEGTGIGLTITKRLVELMQGKVGVSSKVGKGSSFWVELPAQTKAVRNEAYSGTRLPTREATLQAKKTSYKVLYIEDNPMNTKLVSQFLALRNDVELLTAHTPSLGIELAMGTRPDLILLDINMPGMDGFQVLKILQTKASTKRIPVLAVTANAMPHDIERGMAAGFKCYLTKPLDLHLFLDTVDQFLLKS